MKICIAGTNTANLLASFALGFHALGHEAHAFIEKGNSFYTTRLLHHFDRKFFVKDITISPDGGPKVMPSDAFFQFVEPYDIFLFVTGPTLLPAFADLPLLKTMGKKIIFQSTGGCSRFLFPTALYRNYFNTPFPVDTYEKKYLATSTTPQNFTPFADSADTYPHSLAAKIYRETMIALYADVHGSWAEAASLTTAPFYISPNALIMDDIKSNIPHRKIPLIIHAPSNRCYKDSDFIEKSIAELKEEGLEFHWKLLTGLPNAVIKTLLRSADIAIDAISCGMYGVFACEAMASGCLVLGTNQPEAEPLPFNRPVVPISRDNFKEQVRHAVLDLEFRVRQAEASIEYVRTVNAPQASAKYMLSCLQRADRNDYDYYPTLFLDNPFIPDYAGWIRKHNLKLFSTDASFKISSAKEYIPPYIRILLLKALQTRGIHPQTNLSSFLSEFLQLPSVRSDLIPRWSTDGLSQVNPWLWLGPNAGAGFSALHHHTAPPVTSL